MTDSILTIIVGNPDNARFLISASRTKVITPDGGKFYPAFMILNDKPRMNGEIKEVAIISDGLTQEQKILAIRALAEHGGKPGFIARQFFFQNVSP